MTTRQCFMSGTRLSLRSDAYAAGLALTAQGRHADAIARFEQALEEKPGDTRVLFALGNTARALGQSGAATAGSPSSPHAPRKRDLWTGRSA